MENFEDQRILELTATERNLSNFCSLGDRIVLGVAFLKTKSENKQLEPQTVRRAVKIIQDRHPFLRAYLDVQRDQDRMRFVMIEDENEYRSKIELDWATADSREKVIELNRDFNSKLFEEKKVRHLLKFHDLLIFDSKICCLF